MIATVASCDQFNDFGDVDLWKFPESFFSYLEWKKADVLVL